MKGTYTPANPKRILVLDDDEIVANDGHYPAQRGK